MLIENVLPPGALFQVFGQTGEYKSFVAVIHDRRGRERYRVVGS